MYFIHKIKKAIVFLQLLKDTKDSIFQIIDDMTIVFLFFQEIAVSVLNYLR